MKLNTFTAQLVKEAEREYNTAATGPDKVAAIAREALQLDSKLQEEFWTLFVNVKCEITGAAMISRGGMSSSTAGAREVFRAAIISGAYAVILIHNHPSGDATPSAEDISTTKRLIAAGQILGVQVLDHVIIGGAFSDTYYSMKDNGIIE